MDRRLPSPTNAAYRLEHDSSGELLIIPIRHKLKTVFIAASSGMFLTALHLGQAEDHEGILVYIPWALAVFSTLALILSVLTSLAAEEFVQIGAGRIAHGWRLFGFKRQKSYPVGDVSWLTWLEEPEKESDRSKRTISPLFDFGKVGMVKFDVGSKSHLLGATLDVENARQVYAWLARRLPRSASEF